jgi:hypothetical protein
MKIIKIILLSFVTNILIACEPPTDSTQLAYIYKFGNELNYNKDNNIILKYAQYDIEKELSVFESHECSYGETFEALFFVDKNGLGTFVSFLDETTCAENVVKNIKLTNDFVVWQPAKSNGKCIDSYVTVTYHIMTNMDKINIGDAGK